MRFFFSCIFSCINGYIILSLKWLYLKYKYVIKGRSVVFKIEKGFSPEFCKGLSKKCPEHRINRGVPGIFEMHGNVVFSSLF